MTLMSWRIDYGAAFDITKSRRAVNRAAKLLHRELADLWYKEMMPNRFKKGAPQRYKVKKRTEGYNRKKARRWRVSESEAQQFAFAFTGDARRAVNRHKVIKVFPTRWTLRMIAPRYFKMRPFRSNHPPLGSEFTEIIPSEQKRMQRLAQKRFPVLLREQMRKSGRRRKKI